MARSFKRRRRSRKYQAGGHYITTVVVRDIADRLRTEDALRQQRMELYRVLRTATMGELTGALAHEINQPLAAILGNANAGRRFLQSGTSKLTEVDQILEEIVEDTKRAAGVIQRIRSLLEKHEIDTQPLDVNTIVGDIIALVHRDSVKRGVDMRLDLNSNLPLIAWSSQRLSTSGARCSYRCVIPESDFAAEYRALIRSFPHHEIDGVGHGAGHQQIDHRGVGWQDLGTRKPRPGRHHSIFATGDLKINSVVIRGVSRPHFSHDTTR